MDLGKVIVRLVVGGLFVGHGLQKLKGSFDGPGLEGTEQMMESLDMQPPRTHAIAAGVSETAGGAAIALGAATPVAAAALTSVMLTAIRKVHWKNGVWNASGGYEYNAVLIASVVALATDGPGKPSVDALSGKSRWGALGGLFALAAGAAASTAAVAFGSRTS
ncbi:DoxX family protein [Okibacterium endophyticum]